MARKLASIVIIDKLYPIEGADRLEKATISGQGWEVVTAKGEFKPGDMAVYFQIDSYLPADDERYAFLRDRCLRKFVSKGGQVLREGIKIKTVKLRGVLSQGLLMPLAKFPEIGSIEHCGDDVTSVLKVEHFDEVKEMLSPQSGGSVLAADTRGAFPSAFTPKSDEERIQNCSEYFEKYKDATFEVTAKDDGSSETVAYSPTIDAEDPFIVCSRNRMLKRPNEEGGENSAFWKVVYKYDIESKLKRHYETTGKEYAVQGELVGPGINSDRDKYLDYEFHVFRIWDIKEQKFVPSAERLAFCKEMDFLHVQVLHDHFPFFQKYPTMHEALQFAEGKTARGNEREGVVLKQDDGNGDLHFKIVSNRYLLKQAD